jgi:hypothetical protein
MRFIGSEELGCAIDSAIVEDVLVDGLKTNGLLQTWAAVFKHVTLRGKIGRIMISPLATVMATPDQQAAFDAANAAYYANVDWALDISEASFVEIDIRHVPARLIRRDPETQFVVTRERALEGSWRQLDLADTYWPGWIELFLRLGYPDQVFVAPRGHRDYKKLLAGLVALRDAGVAEPN